jgi:uncharacterized SAM-binding protein YcdF (DUF218 family)
LFSRRRAVLLLCLIVFLLILVITSPWWLALLGHRLVNSVDPQAADAIVVLAGDYSGRRILKGCELVRAGYAPVVLVSGSLNWYGTNEADGAIRFAIAKGCDSGMFVPVYNQALSTAQEARALQPEIARRNIRRMLLVTSNFHTARAYRVFHRRMGEAVDIRPVAAADRFFTPDAWWRSREGMKTFYLEATKTVADWIRL